MCDPFTFFSSSICRQSVLNAMCRSTILPIIIWLSALETEKMGCENERIRLRSNNEGYKQLWKETAQRRGGRAMLKDILPCPFGLGLEIDIFQSDEALTWLIQPLHHCDMHLLANAHSCWWAQPSPQGPWLTCPPYSVPMCVCLTPTFLFFYFYCPSSLFSVTMSCPITIWLGRHSVR